MDKLKELRERRESLIVKMQALLNYAESEKRDVTEDEDKEYRVHEAEAERINAEIERREKLQHMEEVARAANAPHIPEYRGRRGARPTEWRNLGEFIYALRFERSDPRLQDAEYVEYDPEVREMSMGVGSEGGYAIPQQFRPQLLSVTPQEAIFRPRCTVIEAGSPPDAALTMPALDQGAGANIYGGVTVYPLGEGATLTETTAKLREMTLTPHQFGAYVVVTNKWLANWTSSGPFIQNQLRRAMIGYEDTQFYSGNGVAKPRGVINQACKITLTRNTAASILSVDIYAMYARLKFGGNPVWIVSQTTLPQLLALKGGNNENIFTFDISQGITPRLLGFPVLFADRSVALGTSGDILLADLGYYLIKDGSGPYVDVSEHVYFTSAKTVVRIIWGVDGNAWLNEAIPLEGSTANTVSPFVVLS